MTPERKMTPIPLNDNEISMSFSGIGVIFTRGRER